MTAEPQPKSELLASIPEQVTEDMHLPPYNKPDSKILLANMGVPKPVQRGATKKDYEFLGDNMTARRLQRDMRVLFGPEMPTIHDDKKPGRDAINFPRLNMAEYAPATTFHFIPQSWMRFFYPKTGVTGPWAFMGGVGTFLWSKEWLIFEHEMLTAFSTTIIVTYALLKFGPRLSKWLRDESDSLSHDWEHWRTGNIAFLEEMQKHYRNELTKSSLIEDLYAIRRVDVDLQVEEEHRSRVKSIYEDTKRRLNYLVAKADSQRQIAHQNMVNWVISNAVSSIGQKQENEVLDSCVTNLKQLGMKNANLI